MSFKADFLKVQKEEAKEYREEKKLNPPLQTLMLDPVWSPVLTEAAQLPEFFSSRLLIDKLLKGEETTKAEYDEAQLLTQYVWRIMDSSREMSALLTNQDFLVFMLNRTDMDLRDKVRAQLDVEKMGGMFTEANIAFLLIRYPGMMGNFYSELHEYNETIGNIEKIDDRVGEFCDKFGIDRARVEEAIRIPDRKQRVKAIRKLVAEGVDSVDDAWSRFKEMLNQKGHVDAMMRWSVDLPRFEKELGDRSAIMGNVLFEAMDDDRQFRASIDDAVFKGRRSFESPKQMSIDEAAELMEEESIKKILERKTVEKFWFDWKGQTWKEKGKPRANVGAWWGSLTVADKKTLRADAMREYVQDALHSHTDGFVAVSVQYIIEEGLADEFGNDFEQLT